MKEYFRICIDLLCEILSLFFFLKKLTEEIVEKQTKRVTCNIVHYLKKSKIVEDKTVEEKTVLVSWLLSKIDVLWLRHHFVFVI